MKRTIRSIFAYLSLMVLMSGALPQAQALAKVTQYSSRFSTAQPRPDNLQTMVVKCRSALNLLRNLWSRAFATYNRRFAPPRVVENGQTEAYYDSGTNTINLNSAFLLREGYLSGCGVRSDGDMGYIVIVAHEYGHAVQANLGLLSGSENPAEELQADALAGVFAAAARQAGMLDPGDIEEACSSLSRAGGSTHGTGQQRVNAFLSGYRGGVGVAFR